MAISTCASLSDTAHIKDALFQINETGLHGTPDFPVAVYEDDVTNNYVNWHWHKEFEVGFVTKGTIFLECGSRKYILNSNDVFFINSDVLHSMYNYNPPQNSVFKSITFLGSIVGGTENSIFHNKYLLPILNNKHFRDIVLTPKDNYHQKVLELLTNVWNTVFSEIPDYEIIVRNELSDLFRILLHLPEENNILINSEHNYLQENRVQIILDYMHHHYAEALSLDDLAQAASVSSNEVLRCFKSIVGQSPIKYLKNYRLQSAAYMLRNTDYSIGAIYELCGFQDNSYFSKSFKELYHCTPREYKLSS